MRRFSFFRVQIGCFSPNAAKEKKSCWVREAHELEVLGLEAEEGRGSLVFAGWSFTG